MARQNIRAKIEKARELLIKQCLEEGSPHTIADPGFSLEAAIDLFISKTAKYALHDDASLDSWINAKLTNTSLQAEIIPVTEIEKWHIDRETGNICHDSGRFFTITGVKVRHRIGYEELQWDQPIIDQPETGILGILAKKFEGVLHFCLQAKEEPGNINSVQLSPTVQATFSNYTQVHGGALPPFLELFLEPPEEKILFSKLQAEDGGRFLFKSNRNMIVLADEAEAADLPDNFIWMTLRQIDALMRHNNLINSCARSVLACLI
ncbi:MAG: NDP-hexose 2,3-dehydratase family protein [Nitrospirae bacterium]|nr:NDP-hexose 2,3-dehydratase family protein [Nitrospirota bacterium]